MVVRDRVEDLICELRKHRYQREYFYEVRAWDRSANYHSLSAAQRASRLIFLNKTCFNGLYRVNSRGQFNVPFGAYVNPGIFDPRNLRLCSEALRGVDLRCENYLEIENRTQAGDFVYFDPPYAPLNSTSNFTNYSKDGFDLSDQVALRDLCLRLDKMGVLFALSNSSAPLIVELYSSFRLRYVEAARAINSKAVGRGKIKEVLLTNY